MNSTANVFALLGVFFFVVGFVSMMGGDVGAQVFFLFLQVVSLICQVGAPLEEPDDDWY